MLTNALKTPNTEPKRLAAMHALFAARTSKKCAQEIPISAHPTSSSIVPCASWQAKPWRLVQSTLLRLKSPMESRYAQLFTSTVGGSYRPAMNLSRFISVPSKYQNPALEDTTSSKGARTSSTARRSVKHSYL